MEKNKNSNLELSQYIKAVKEIKNAIIDSRYRAARQMNKEVLSLYYCVGNYVSVNSRVIELSDDIKFKDLLNRQIPSATFYDKPEILINS